MLAIAPHKCGAIFLSAVDGCAGYAQNSLKQFLDRLGVSRTAKARPIGLPPSCGFHLDEDYLFRPQNKCDQEENDQDAPQDRKPTLNGTGGQESISPRRQQRIRRSARFRPNRAEESSSQLESGRCVECPPPKLIGELCQAMIGSYRPMAENRTMGPHCSDCSSYCQNTPQWGLSAPQQNAPEKAIEVRKACLDSFDLAF